MRGAPVNPGRLAPMPSLNMLHEVGGLPPAARLVEAGTPEFDFHLVDKIEVWADDAARIYAQAVAAQWDPETAIPWNAEFTLPDDVEDGGRADHDVSHRKRNRGADHPQPLHRAASSAFPRGDAGARRPGSRRGAPHRRLHATGAAQTRRAGPVDERRPGVAQDSGRRA